MKHTFALILFTLCFCIASHAQTSTSDKQKIDGSQAKQQQTIADTPDIIEARRLSAEVVKLYGARKFDEALPLAERAVRLRETALSPEHHLVAAALYNTMMVQIERGKSSEAKKLGRRSLAILEKNYGTQDVKLIPVLDVIARLDYKEREYGAAEDTFKRILAIRQKSGGAESLETAEALLNLARVYHSKGGSNDKAEKFYRQALAIQEKTLGQNDKRIAATLENYAGLLFLLNRTEEATKLEDRRIAIAIGGQPNSTLAPITGGILNGKALLKPAPAYPAEAKQQRAQGTVVVEILVNELGRVVSARAISGPQSLREASERAALSSRYSQTLLDGVPVKVSGTITYNFRLE